MTRPIHHHFTASASVHRRRVFRRLAVPMLAASATMLAIANSPASAGIVPTVPLASAANYSVLGGSTATNTGPSVLAQNLGVNPGSEIPGFDQATVLGTTEVANAIALQAQNDLITAYDSAAGRSVEFTEPNPDLTGLTLIPGVYSGTAKSELNLSGRLVLDGQGLADAVFIFQTDSTLITGPGSRIDLINGATECNVFWQVGSSATLATNSLFVGTIMAQISIGVQTGAVVHGRALARTGAVTLDTNTFTEPSCIPTEAVAPTTTIATTTTIAAAPVTTVVSTVATTVPLVVTDITLPNTGRSQFVSTTSVAVVALLLGAAALMIARRRRSAT